MKTQVVIAVHTPERPLRRAIESVLADPESGVIVAAHNVSPNLLDIPSDDRVRVIEHRGDHGMPGAPRNAGLSVVTAPWVSMLDSDDRFEPGALATMRERAKQTGSQIVIAPFLKEGKRGKTWMPTFRTSGLRAYRDGLFYRTAPFGLFSRTVMRGVDYRDDVRTGEDIRVTADLYTRGLKIAHFWKDPAYVVGADAKKRITTTPMDLRESGRPWHELWDEEFVSRWDRATRHAYGVKVARIHVSDSITARSEESSWADGEFEWLAAAVQRLAAEAPNFSRPLPAGQARMMDAIKAGDLAGALSAHAAGWQGDNPRNPIHSLSEHEGPLRWRIKNYVANKRRSTK